MMNSLKFEYHHEEECEVNGISWPTSRDYLRQVSRLWQTTINISICWVMTQSGSFYSFVNNIKTHSFLPDCHCVTVLQCLLKQITMGTSHMVVWDFPWWETCPISVPCRHTGATEAWWVTDQPNRWWFHLREEPCTFIILTLSGQNRGKTVWHALDLIPLTGTATRLYRELSCMPAY